MIDVVNFDQFNNWFENSGSYKNNFTRAGRIALFDYLEEYEDSTGEQMEFDPIALCCEFSEYKDEFEIAQNYRIEPEGEDEEEKAEYIRNYLEDRTEVIQFEGGLIIRDY